MVEAMAAIDLLVAVKMNLTTVAESAIACPPEPQGRVTRACETIEAVIEEPRWLTGLRDANGEH